MGKQHQAKLAATEQAFAFWGLGGDGIVTWGSPTAGGAIPLAQHELRRGNGWISMEWLKGKPEPDTTRWCPSSLAKLVYKYYN